MVLCLATSAAQALRRALATRPSSTPCSGRAGSTLWNRCTQSLRPVRPEWSGAGRVSSSRQLVCMHEQEVCRWYISINMHAHCSRKPCLCCYSCYSAMVQGTCILSGLLPQCACSFDPLVCYCCYAVSSAATARRAKCSKCLCKDNKHPYVHSTGKTSHPPVPPPAHPPLQTPRALRCRCRWQPALQASSGGAPGHAGRCGAVGSCLHPPCSCTCASACCGWACTWPPVARLCPAPAGEQQEAPPATYKQGAQKLFRGGFVTGVDMRHCSLSPFCIQQHAVFWRM
jgi:hypothetical protein